MKAKKPLFLIGGGMNISGASEAFKELVEKTNIPVISTLMGIGAMPTNHPMFIGMLGMHGIYAANQAISECDLIFSIGCRFNDRITGNLNKFASNAIIIHVDIDPASISRDINVEIPIVGDAKIVIEELLPLVSKTSNDPWNLKIDNWKKEQPCIVVPGNKRISPMEVIQSINKTFPDAIVTTDVGQHQMWTAQFGVFSKPRTFLTSGGFGTMGYGLPAAIGAQIGNRDKVVVNISGDGGIQMNIQELATAVQEELPIIIAVFNNNYLGMVRQWQELFNNKRYSGTCLRRNINCPRNCSGPSLDCPEYTPNFVKLAEAYGAIGIRVSNKDEIIPALERAKTSKTVPVLIEFTTEHEYNVMPMVPAGASLTEMLLEGGI